MNKVEVHPGVKGLRGGNKQMWLRTNRGEVEQYYHQNGPDATLKRFNMREDTLKRFFARRGDEIRITKLSENDRYVMRVAMEGIREVKRRVSDLEEWKAEIEPIIQVGRGIISTLGSGYIQSQKIQGKKDPLSLADLRGKSGK